ncbi:MAG: hypothetical protein SWK90_11860 [Chloroflexota bacterium]|nr:hypothetical protein [Chloroflexota bacterium]
MDEHLPSPPDRSPPLESLVEVLRAVVQKIKEPPYLFIIGISVLVVILVLGVTTMAPEISGPLYAALVVIGVLALVALAGGVITAVMGTRMERADTADTPAETQERVPDDTPVPTPTPSEPTTPAADQEKTIVHERPIPPDCESLNHQLEMARKTLNALEVQEAGYTVLTMPAHLQVELQEQRRKVAKLERKLAECLGREVRQ